MFLNKLFLVGHSVSITQRFVKSVISSCAVQKEELLIPREISLMKETLYFQLKFCEANENKIKSVLNILEEFTNYQTKFN